MAIINYPIPSANYRVIFGNIAAILLDELSNQFTISSDPDLNIVNIWKERNTSFNPSEFPTINITLSAVATTQKFQKQTDVDPVYFIDIYVVKSSDNGFNGDELGADSAWKVANVVDHILSYPNYRTLGGFPNVKHTEVTRRSTGEVESEDGTKCMVVRVELTVSTINTSEPIAPIELKGNDTTVKLGNTEKGYFYTLNT